MVGASSTMEASHAFVFEKHHDPMVIDEDLLQAEDIDLNDQMDPQCCTEYVNDIFEYCREKELKDQVSESYMVLQVDVNEKMRGILVDWMVEVQVKFKLLTETMFLSVNIIDRYLAQKSVRRDKLQLIGITSMLLASKFEEIYAPEVRDFIYISDKAYPREEILKTERLILATLDFNLSSPTALHFLRRFSKAARSDSRTHCLSKYIAELTLTEYSVLQFTPSQVAAASVYVARRMTDKTPSWTPTLEKYTTYCEEELLPCIEELNDIVKKADKSQLKAIRKKYLSPKLLEVARIPPVDLVRTVY